MNQRNRPKMRIEHLEARQLLAGDLAHNFLSPLDTNGDTELSAIDALVVVNDINDDSPSRSDMMTDVNDDSVLTAIDALQVINALNSTESPNAATEQEVYVGSSSGAQAKVEFETTAFERELSVRIMGAQANDSYFVTLGNFDLGVIETDSKGRGRIKLSAGDDNRDHLPLPNSFDGLGADMELVVGDIIQSRLGNGIVIGDDDRSDDDNTNDDSTSNQAGQVNLIAIFPAPNMKAEYEIDERRGTLVTKFEVEVEDVSPGEQFDVFVNGSHLLTLTADAEGEAKIKFSTHPRDGKEVQLPEGFPQLQLGDEIRIGTQTAQFANTI